MFTFHRNYFFSALILFLTEVFIAVFVHDSIVRPYIGDFLVVILIYCSVRAVVKSSRITVAVYTLLFSYLIEVLQYFRFVSALGLKNNKLANVVLGNSFAWTDILAYTLGIATVLIFENLKTNYLSKNKI